MAMDNPPVIDGFPSYKPSFWYGISQPRLMTPEGIHPQSPVTHLQRPPTLITLKRTVLAKGRHWPAVMMSPWRRGFQLDGSGLWATLYAPKNMNMKMATQMCLAIFGYPIFSQSQMTKKPG